LPEAIPVPEEKEAAVQISDTYVVHYLLQGTSRAPQQIIWQEREADEPGYVVHLEDTEIVLHIVPSRSGSYLVLRFRHANDEFSLREPAARGWVNKKYSTPDERDLAESLRALMRAVAAQCSERRMRTMENPDTVRNRVYRHLLFNEAFDKRQEIAS
jgi:hypothetical protein